MLNSDSESPIYISACEETDTEGFFRVTFSLRQGFFENGSTITILSHSISIHDCQTKHFAIILSQEFLQQELEVTIHPRDGMCIRRFLVEPFCKIPQITFTIDSWNQVCENETPTLKIFLTPQKIVNCKTHPLGKGYILSLKSGSISAFSDVHSPSHGSVEFNAPLDFFKNLASCESQQGFQLLLTAAQKCHLCCKKSSLQTFYCCQLLKKLGCREKSGCCEHLAKIKEPCVMMDLIDDKFSFIVFKYSNSREHDDDDDCNFKAEYIIKGKTCHGKKIQERITRYNELSTSIPTEATRNISWQVNFIDKSNGKVCAHFAGDLC